MKKIISTAFLTLALSVPIQLFADNLSDSNKIFNWAEKKYAEYFLPAGGSTEELQGYILRYYSKTNTYLGTIEGKVYVYGNIFDGLLKVGTIDHLLKVINTENKSIFNPLNDTGITENGTNSTCTGIEAEAYILDCSHGRDAQAEAGTLKKTGGGLVGFDFTKLDTRGKPLDASATNWSCVKDNNTGLIWEVKTNDKGLHGQHIYSWYDTNPKTNGGYSGAENVERVSCFGHSWYDDLGRVTPAPAESCNTQAFVARVNANGLCGASDWRVPNREELRSIVNYGNNSVLDTLVDSGNVSAIDTHYFPYMTHGFWTSTSRASWTIAPGYPTDRIDADTPLVIKSERAYVFDFSNITGAFSSFPSTHKKDRALQIILVHDDINN